MADLSIIILSYNTRETTLNCLRSLYTVLKSEEKTQVIVVDNASTDGSYEAIEQYKSKNHRDLEIVRAKQNLGFSRGNNLGLGLAKGRYVLFLNSDVLADKVAFPELLSYLDHHPDVGVLTVKVLLGNGQLDWASHRGFPTPWRSFCYFLGLEKLATTLNLFKRWFGGYHLLDRQLINIHEIDSPSGAFFLTRRDLLEKIKGFDERFFMYGEDLDLAFRIKELGFKVIFYPGQSILHLKGQSGFRTVDRSIQKKIKKYFYEAMLLFYNKHYRQKYPGIMNQLVYWAIVFKEKTA